MKTPLEKSFYDLIRSCEKRLLHIPIDSHKFCQETSEILVETTFCPTIDELQSPYLWQSPYQHFKVNEFGQFTLTLHRWENYFLDLYVWPKQQATGIHDHHFAGAFKVLRGDYQQTCFKFKDAKEISDGIFKGELIRSGYDALKLNEVRMIPEGDGLIHWVNHTEKVNMTLCLRTVDLKPALNEYLLPHFKISNKHPEHPIRKELDLNWLLLTEHNQKHLISKKISELEIIRYTTKKNSSDKGLDQWWEHTSNQRPNSPIIEIKQAFEKSAQLFR